jgi:CheY-like chemotaxis protein
MKPTEGVEAMPIESTVLVIDGSDAPRAALTHRIRKMGYRAMRAKTPEEAFAIVEEHRHQVTAALIPPHSPSPISARR